MNCLSFEFDVPHFHLHWWFGIVVKISLLLGGGAGVQFLDRMNRTQYCLGLATAAVFLHSSVVQALCHGDELCHSYDEDLHLIYCLK